MIEGVRKNAAQFAREVTEKCKLKVIYNTTCLTHWKFSIGETSKPPQKRFKEHRADIITKNEKDRVPTAPKRAGTREANRYFPAINERRKEKRLGKRY